MITGRSTPSRDTFATAQDLHSWFFAYPRMHRGQLPKPPASSVGRGSFKKIISIAKGNDD